MAVAETLSFSRAAERLYVSQSTLSEQIKQLETELGSPLFRRTSHNVERTEAGERLLPIAAMVCRDVDACRDIVRELRDGISGTLRVGVTSTCKNLLKQPLREMCRRYPKLRIEVQYANGMDIAQLLMHKQVDIALTMQPHHTPEGVESEEIFRSRLCMICSSGHALADRKEVSLSELLSYPMVLPSEELYYRRELDRILERNSQHAEAKMEVSDPDYLLEVLEHSPLWTMHAGIVAAGKENLRAIPIKECTEELVGCLHKLRSSVSKQSASALSEMIRTEAKLQAIRNGC